MKSMIPTSTLGRRMALVTGIAGAAAVLAGCSGPRALNMLVPSGTYRGRNDIAYGSHERQRLDVYQPLQQAPDAPLVVFFYGGNWSSGERANYRFVGEALASAGIVTVVADYRLSPQVRWRDILRDCALATRWAVDNAAQLGASTKRIFLMGHSAGAYNAAMLALDARWLAQQKLQNKDLAGWVGIAGPYNFLPIRDPLSQVAFDWPNTPADSQPINHVRGATVPALLLAAHDDKVVNPQRNTLTLSQRLEAEGTRVRTQVFDRVSHVTIAGALGTPLRWMAPVRQAVVEFVAGVAPRAEMKMREG